LAIALDGACASAATSSLLSAVIHIAWRGEVRAVDEDRVERTAALSGIASQAVRASTTGWLRVPS